MPPAAPVSAEEAGQALGAAVTQDAFLGGRVSAFQPADGFRAAIDTVCLAAAIEPERGRDVLDVGAGAGIAGLCLKARVPEVRITGLEIDPRLSALAKLNFDHNQLDGRLICDDLFAHTQAHGPFSQIMTNPPFLTEGRGTPPPNADKARAHMAPLGLRAWIAACLGLLAPKGTLTLVCRADHVDEAIMALKGRAGEISLFPLWPGPGKAARRVIVRAKAGVKTPARLCAGLVLHSDRERYTPAAEAVLRHGAPLDWC